MKAISPIRSVRSCYEAVCCLSDQSLAISRSKNPLEESISLMYDMNDCYCKLKELVPSIPQNKKVSKMEILQHVIDYIFDLQIALESQQQEPGNNPASSSPILTLQRSELSSEGDRLGFCH
ncbi:DNA-binding protein inhibitor ID-3-A-like [Cetorhinus maximus]